MAVSGKEQPVLDSAKSARRCFEASRSDESKSLAHSTIVVIWVVLAVFGWALLFALGALMLKVF